MKIEEPVCDCGVIHADVVEAVKKKMPAGGESDALSGFFKVLGDGTRVKIMWALDTSEMCVCDLAVLLNMTKSAVSHQLGSLRQARLVRYRREGRVVFYSLADDHVKEIFEKATEHLAENRTESGDP